MKRTVVVNGVEHEVELSDGTVRVDGTPYRVMVEPRPGGFDVRVDGELFDVELDRQAFGVYRGSVDGTDAELLYAAQAKKRGGPGAGRAHRLEAPMPGTVLDVEVAVGDEIAVGTCLLTLEAMKMENEIVAEQAGVVKQLEVAAGDSVDGGQLLAVIGPAEEE